jgi:hypothetical protein
MLHNPGLDINFLKILTSSHYLFIIKAKNVPFYFIGSIINGGRNSW